MFKSRISAVLATNLHGTCAWLEDKYSSWSLAYRKCFLVGAHNAGFAFRTIDRSKFMGRLASGHNPMLMIIGAASIRDYLAQGIVALD